MSKREKIFQVIGVKENIGNKLKEKRLFIGYSLGDISDMTDFSKSTVINLEKGKATNIDYYIGYAQALDFKLSKLFDVQISYKPRYQLSQNKKDRIFLTRKLFKLRNEESFFLAEVTVEDVINRLLQKNEIINKKQISSDVSRILLNWVEDGTLNLVRKQGRNNVYREFPAKLDETKI
jgi:transcriptional regulator with XRE-family HTH domain